MALIQSDRIQLEEVTFDDVAFIFELLNNPTWIENIGDRGINTKEDAANYIQKALRDSYLKNGFGLYKMILKVECIPIGLCGLLKRADLEHVDIGFAILPQYARNGYTYEIAKATYNHARNKLGFEILYGITSKENTASQNLLKKLGLKFIKNINFGNFEEESLLFSSE